MRGPSTELRVIFAEEFRRQLRRPSFTVFTVLFAALMLIAIPVTSLVVNLTEDDSTADTGVVDEKETEGEEAPLERIGYVDPAGVLPGPGQQDWPRLYDDRAEGIQAVQQGEIDTLFILSADYVESGAVEEYEPAGVGRNLWGSPAEWDFEGFLRAQLTAGQLEDDVLARVLNPASYQRFEIEADGSVSEEITTTHELGELIIPIFFAVLLMIAVLTGSGALLRSVSEEKETRMVEMLVTSASPLSLMTGKLLALWCAGLIQIAVWVGVGAFALPAVFDRIPDGGELTISAGLLATVALSFVLGYFLFSVLAMFIATLVNSTQSAQQYTGLMSLLAGLPLYMIGLFINIPDGTFTQILTWFPFSAPTMLMIRNAIGSNMSGGEIAASLAIVAATALLLLWVAARVFRAGILLSGQRITPGNVWTALRNAD